MFSVRLAAVCFAAFSFCWPTAWAQENAPPLTAAPLKPDVRVLIDISGSMKQNDPQNLRRPAVELLVKLLPPGSKAGIWSFGNDTQRLVPHETITDAWRQLALEKARSIDSRTLYTNIGSALEAATANATTDGYRPSLILLTDGVVDVSKDDGVNRREQQRIISELLPAARQAGFAVHTIALSDKADSALLDRLARETGGLATVAKSADELLSAFLRIFDAAAPAEQVTLEGNRFRIDPSIEEFTALIFHDDRTEKTQIQSPEGASLDHRSKSENVNWHRTGAYDLATVKQPAPGDWHVLADTGPDSRVTVVSNLSLRVRDLPVNLYKGQSMPISFALQEDGTVIQRPEFLSLMTYQVALQREAGGEYETVWQTEVPNDKPPVSGIYNVQLPRLGDTGQFRLLIEVDGKSFQRKFAHSFSVRTLFHAEITGETDEVGRPYYSLNLYSNTSEIVQDKTQVAVTLKTPQDRRLVRPMQLTEPGKWQLRLNPEDTGRYHVQITVRGTDSQNVDFQYSLDDLSFYYSPERGFVREVEGQAPEVVQLPEPETEETPVAEGGEPESVPEDGPDNVPDEKPQPVSEQAAESKTEAPAEPRVEQETESVDWLFLSSFMLGNMALVGLGFWAYRRFMMDEKSPEEILSEFSDEAITTAPSVDAPEAPGSGSVPHGKNTASVEDDDGMEPEMDSLGSAEASLESPEEADEHEEERYTAIDDDPVGGDPAGADNPLDQDDDENEEEGSLDEALASIMGELNKGEDDEDLDDDFDFGEESEALDEEGDQASDEAWDGIDDTDDEAREK